MIRACRARLRRLVLGADGADHGRANRLQPLDEDQADATRRRMDQHRPARLHLRAAFDQKFGGAALEQRRRRRFVIDIVGQREEGGGGDQAMGGIGAALRPEIADALAGRDIRDAIPHRLDHAYAFDAKLCGQCDRVDAAAMIGVDEIQPYRAVADERFPRAGSGQLHVVKADDLRSAGRLYPCNACHRNAPYQVLPPTQSPAAALNSRISMSDQICAL